MKSKPKRREPFYLVENSICGTKYFVKTGYTKYVNGKRYTNPTITLFCRHFVLFYLCKKKTDLKMSNLAWSYSPKFTKKVHKPTLSYVPQDFKTFLQNKIVPVPAINDHERDYVIRRALALYRLCWINVPNGWSLVDERLREVLGDSWLDDYEHRNGEKVEVLSDGEDV